MNKTEEVPMSEQIAFAKTVLKLNNCSKSTGKYFHCDNRDTRKCPIQEAYCNDILCHIDDLHDKATIFLKKHSLPQMLSEILSENDKDITI
jgi:hypothetical protein